MLPLHDINRTSRAPWATYTFIALNVVVYVYQFLFLPSAQLGEFVARHAVVPMHLLSGYGPSLSTPFTSMFMHGGLGHLVSNLWFLHIFGDNVEDALGHVRYIAFYVLTGIAAVLTHALTSPASSVPMLGASGAISGVLGAYVLLFPRARIVAFAFLFTFEVPAVLFILGWFAMQLVSGLGSLGQHVGGGVAFFAHVGGFVAGVVLLLLFGKPKRVAQSYAAQRLLPRRRRS